MKWPIRRIVLIAVAVASFVGSRGVNAQSPVAVSPAAASTVRGIRAAVASNPQVAAALQERRAAYLALRSAEAQRYRAARLARIGRLYRRPIIVGPANGVFQNGSAFGFSSYGPTTFGTTSFGTGTFGTGGFGPSYFGVRPTPGFGGTSFGTSGFGTGISFQINR
ncbi:MAG: hypothetical protein AAGG48_27175 [Planctomycetota bacterium]